MSERVRSWLSAVCELHGMPVPPLQDLADDDPVEVWFVGLEAISAVVDLNVVSAWPGYHTLRRADAASRAKDVPRGCLPLGTASLAYLVVTENGSIADFDVVEDSLGDVASDLPTLCAMLTTAAAGGRIRVDEGHLTGDVRELTGPVPAAAEEEHELLSQVFVPGVDEIGVITRLGELGPAASGGYLYARAAGSGPVAEAACRALLRIGPDGRRAIARLARRPWKGRAARAILREEQPRG